MALTRHRRLSPHRILLHGVLRVVNHPRLTLLVSAVLLANCVALAMWQLDVSTDQNKLFSPKVKFFRDYLEFNEKFPENEAIYILVEPADPNAPPPSVPRWTAAADAIAARLRQLDAYVKSVDQRVPLDKLGTQGILFDSPESVRQSLADAARFAPLAKLWAERPGTLTRLLGNTPMQRFLAGLTTQPIDAETTSFLQLLTTSWLKTLDHPAGPLRLGEEIPDLQSLDGADPSRLGYYYVPDETAPARRLLLVRVYPRENRDSLASTYTTVDAIRRAAKDAGKAFPEFRVGVTGRPALEADEMKTTDRDSHRSETIALIAVFVGLVVMLRSFWLALAAVLSLGVAIGWTFGWATLSIGDLNLLSLVFVIALIGIGMDYLVQVLTRYRQEAARSRRPQAVWLRVFIHIGPPITTACFGAAGAFLVSVFTDFRGAADLGVIAGGGLLLCLLAGYTVLPALLTLFPARLSPQPPPPLHAEAYDAGAATRRLIFPAVWLLLLIAAIPYAMKAEFDPGLLDLQARNLPSVKLVRKLQTWSAVVLSKDVNVLRRAREALNNSATVDSTESILTAYENYDWLKARESQLPAIDWSPPDPVTPADLPRIAGAARALADHFDRPTTSPSTTTTSAIDLARSLRQFADRLTSAPNPDQLASALSNWQTAFVAELHRLMAQLHPGPLDISKLPRELRSHLVADDGTFALYIYPEEDLWNRQNLTNFVNDIETRLHNTPGVPDPTGIAIDVYHTTGAVRESFIRATAYALALILVLVFLDLRSIAQTLLAVSVLALGLPMLAAVMVLLKSLAEKGLLGDQSVTQFTWNFANFFGLPILIGAGHEYGVFMVHRYREAARDPRRAWRGWDVSDRALLLCAYVTSSSFAFFWALGHHEGLRSLGMVMALGTACIYLVSLLVLRPILRWRLARIPKGP